MQVLVLGGTRFVGYHIVAQLLRCGAEVTLLHRGRTPSPFGADVRCLADDRRALTAKTAAALARTWDTVIDTSGTDLDDVRGPMEYIGDVGLYLFVSTCGVYQRNQAPAEGMTEQSLVLSETDSSVSTASALRKLQCERYLQRELRGRRTPLLIARLGLTVGPLDRSDRLAYWLDRAMRAGKALVPMDQRQVLQLIDARDVAEFVSHAATAARPLGGVVNVAGQRITAARFVAVIAEVAGAQFQPVWVGDKFALANGLKPWTEVPLWLPLSSPELALMHAATAKAETMELRFRSLAESLHDSLDWWTENRRWNTTWLAPEREKALLASWTVT